MDLGGVYNVTRLVYWNNFPFTNPTSAGMQTGEASNGATVTYINGYGATIGTYLLTGGMIQSIVRMA